MALLRLVSSTIILAASVLGAPADNLQNRQDAPVEIPELRITNPGSVHGPVAVVPEHIVYTHEQILQASNATIIHPSPEVAGSTRRGKRAIIGADNRVLWESTDYPWEAVGRLVTSNGVLCSANLVGPRIISTAKHCVAAAGVTYHFEPSFDNVERFAGAGVTAIITVGEPADETGQCHTRDDWAIMILDARLGDARGYFGAQVIDPSLEGQQNTYTLGYPGDRSGANQPYMQNSITVRPMGTTANADCDQYGPLVTDADVMPGQSGSPLWWKDASMNRYQLGVLVSGTATDTFASGGPSWVNAIANARVDYNN